MKHSSNLYRPSLLAGAAFCLLAALAASGCGGAGSNSALTGKVTYKGQPVPGTLTLSINRSGTPATYPILVGEDGKFTTSGVPKGTYMVSVTPFPALPTAPQLPAGVIPPAAMEGKPPSVAGNIKPLKHVDIPPKYLQPASSGFSWEVKEGAQKKDFDLTD